VRLARVQWRSLSRLLRQQKLDFTGMPPANIAVPLARLTALSQPVPAPL